MTEARHKKVMHGSAYVKLPAEVNPWRWKAGWWLPWAGEQLLSGHRVMRNIGTRSMWWLSNSVKTIHQCAIHFKMLILSFINFTSIKKSFEKTNKLFF